MELDRKIEMDDNTPGLFVMIKTWPFSSSYRQKDNFSSLMVTSIIDFEDFLEAQISVSRRDFDQVEIIFLP